MLLRSNFRKVINEIQPILGLERNGQLQSWLALPRSSHVCTSMCVCSSVAHVLPSASTISSYNMGFNTMVLDLNCTEFQATIGLSVYALGFGVVPLVTASFSEEFGRQPLYIGSSIGFILMYMMIALYVCIQMSSYINSYVSRTGQQTFKPLY
jgi:MFS family permease